MIIIFSSCMNNEWMHVTLQMEQNFDKLLQMLGLEDKSIEGLKGPLSYQTVMFGEKEEPWHVYLKRWKAEREDGVKTKAIYVLENVAEYLGTYGADEGDLFTLYMDECGRLSGRLDKKIRAAIAVGKSDVASELQIQAMGKCMRRPSCQKPNGHSGFCNGAVIIRPKRKEAPVDKERESEREREAMFRRLLKEISYQRQQEAAHQTSKMQNAVVPDEGRQEASPNDLRRVVSNALGNQYQTQQQGQQGWKSAWASQILQQQQPNPSPYSMTRTFQDGGKSDVQHVYPLSDYLHYQREQQIQQQQKIQQLFASMQRTNTYQDPGRLYPNEGYNRSIDPLTRSQSADAHQAICESLLSLKYGDQSQNANTNADPQAPTRGAPTGGDPQENRMPLLQQIRCYLEQQQQQQIPMDQQQPSLKTQDLAYQLQSAVQQHASSAIDPGITALLTSVFSRMTRAERREIKESLKKSLLQQTLEMLSSVS
jgi:hypothetical protein